MNISRIKEIYQTASNKYEDLYNYFLNECKFEILSIRIKLGVNIYRGRVYKDLNEITSKNDVKYPPTSYSYSRIGKPNQIWFYGSNSHMAPLSEMLPNWYYTKQHGDDINVVLSAWKVQKDIDVLIIPDLSGVNEICKNMNLDAYKDDSGFWEYICKMFQTTTLESKDIYQFTSAFANALIEKAKRQRSNIEESNIGGIFYPSVQYPEKSNLALFPTIVDNKKLILDSLVKKTFRQYWLNGKKPEYERISEPEIGYYDRDKDVISWNTK